MVQPKLVVVDDEEDIGSFICDVATCNGYIAEHYQHANDFIGKYYGDADVIMLDLMMPGVDGVELIRYLASKLCLARLILISGFDEGVLHSAQKLAVEHGLNFYSTLNKPFRVHELSSLLKQIASEPVDNVRNETQYYIPVKEDLHKALVKNELVMYYQPKISLHTGNVSGLEALVRWRNPEHGLIPPDSFIPLAEQCGLIDQLTWVIFRQVAEQCHRWNKMGLNLSVAVNMSASTLRELTLPEYLNKLIIGHEINPNQIIMEVTETALMEELVKSLDILTRLRMKGFKLSIDDFGTGYSSLVQLHRAPFSEIKIDRSFVQGMAKDKEALAIVETVVVLGHKLGMQVVAEGVETQADLVQLTEMGCDFAQGYHILRPQPGNAITDWIMHHVKESHG